MSNLIDNDAVQITDIYLNSLNNFSDYFKEIEEGYNILAGKHYDKKQIKAFEKSHRPHNVFNIVFPLFNSIIGEFILNETMPHVYPRPGADPQTAAQLENFIDNLYIDNEVRHELSMTLLSALIKIGYVYVRYSNERELDGSIVITNQDEFSVVFDPRAKSPFLDDAKFLIRVKWLEFDDILRIAPHLRNKLKSLEADQNKKEYWSSIQFINDNAGKNMQSPMVVDKKNGQYAVLEFNEMRYERVPVAVDVNTGEAEPFFLEGKRADLYLQVHPERKIIERETQVKYITTVLPAFAIKIEEKKANIQDGSFDIIPFIPYPYAKYATDGFGVMRNVIGPQRDFNAQKNRTTEILDKAVANPLFYKPANLLNPNEVEGYGVKTGLKIKIKENKTISDSIQEGRPPQYPFSSEQLSKEDQELIMRIAAITPNFIGQSEGSREASSLFSQKLRQAQKAIAVMDTNFRLMQKRMWQKVIRALQQNVKTEKFFFMSGQKGANVIGFNIQLNDKILFNLNGGRYDVFISTLQNDPTARHIRFMQKTELIQLIANLYGPDAIDPRWWLEEADLGDIEQLIQNIEESIQQRQAMAAKQSGLQDQAAVLALAKQKLQLEGEDVK